MALNVTNFMMTHSVKVSTMPNKSKIQYHVAVEGVVELDLTDTLKAVRKRKLDSEFLN